MVVVGIPSDDRTTFKASEARRKELSMVFSRRSKPLSEGAIALLTSGSVDVQSMVDARYSLRSWEEAFAGLVTRSGVKVMVHPDGGGSL